MKSIQRLISIILSIAILTMSVPALADGGQSGSFWDTISGAINQAVDSASDAASQALDAASDALNEAQAAASQAFDDVRDAASQLWDETTNFATQAWDETSKLVGEVWSESSAWATEIWGDVSTWATETYDEASGAVTAWWAETFDEVTDDANDMWRWLRVEAAALSGEFKDELIEIKTALSDEIDEEIKLVFCDLLADLGLDEDEAEKVWDTVKLYAEIKGLSQRTLARLALPYLFQLTLDEAAVDYGIPAIAVAQYITAIIEKLDIVDEGDAEERVEKLESVLDSVD